MILRLPIESTEGDRLATIRHLKSLGIAASKVNKRLFKTDCPVIAVHIRSFDPDFHEKHTLLSYFIRENELHKIGPAD